MSPKIIQEFAASFLQVAPELATRNLGVALVAPVDMTVVVPGVTAPMVGCPAPVIQNTLISVPTAKLNVASVGMLNCCVAALFIENKLPSSPLTNVYDAVFAVYVEDIFGVLITGVVKVLFVKVSVEVRATKVSAPLGTVTVPPLEILAITGVVKVLFVKV